MSTARPDIQELIRSAPPDRELIWQDPHRPRYHLTPPEGFFNDPNGVQRAGERYVTIAVARRVLVRRVVRQQQRDVDIDSRQTIP